jgi:GxxExxY protein
MTHNEITEAIVDSALHIHRSLGPGLLESVYLAVLAYELKKKGLNVATEVSVPVRWERITLELGFRADMIVEDRVIVELKSVEKMSPVHKKQLLTYLKVMDKRLGLLINFGDDLLTNGIARVANNLRE